MRSIFPKNGQTFVLNLFEKQAQNIDCLETKGYIQKLNFDDNCNTKTAMFQ